jgi:hypothetical protein
LKLVTGAVAARGDVVREAVPKVEGAAKLKLVRAQDATMDAAINTARHDLISDLPFCARRLNFKSTGAETWFRNGFDAKPQTCSAMLRFRLGALSLRLHRNAPGLPDEKATVA